MYKIKPKLTLGHVNINQRHDSQHSSPYDHVLNDYMRKLKLKSHQNLVIQTRDSVLNLHKR